jgi:addiction module RelE/StbE family toxin
MTRQKPRLLWSGPALNDLRAIREYVSQDSPAAASKLANKLRRSVERLIDHPDSGRRVPELEPLGYREVIVAPYRIVYEQRGAAIVILRVWHSKRDLASAATPQQK